MWYSEKIEGGSILSRSILPLIKLTTMKKQMKESQEHTETTEAKS